jgi:hypothetical protein
MPARVGVWKKKREDLEHRRILLLQRFEQSPSDPHLALEIKIIDDQIAACTQQMERTNSEGGMMDLARRV